MFPQQAKSMAKHEVKSDSINDTGGALAVPAASAGSAASRVAMIASLLEKRRLNEQSRIDRIQESLTEKHAQMMQTMATELRGEATEAHHAFVEAEAWRGRHAQSLQKSSFWLRPSLACCSTFLRPPSSAEGGWPRSSIVSLGISDWIRAGASCQHHGHPM